MNFSVLFIVNSHGIKIMLVGTDIRPLLYAVKGTQTLDDEIFKSDRTFIVHSASFALCSFTEIPVAAHFSFAITYSTTFFFLLLSLMLMQFRGTFRAHMTLSSRFVATVCSTPANMATPSRWNCDDDLVRRSQQCGDMPHLYTVGRYL
jgi:hypothetical protein